MHTINLQQIEKSVDFTGTYDVVDIWKTIQGEGPLSGTPAVFIRLAGCNLACPNCDTDYTTNRKKMSRLDIMLQVTKLMQNSNLVVITGGEPFRQDLDHLLKLLLDQHVFVQIETNGTNPEWPVPKHKNLQIVCSPKVQKISPYMMERISFLKYVLNYEWVDAADGLPDRVLGYSHPIQKPWPGMKGRVFVQPEWHEDHYAYHANIKACVKSCLKFGYHLSFQIHKLIGVP